MRASKKKKEGLLVNFYRALPFLDMLAINKYNRGDRRNKFGRPSEQSITIEQKIFQGFEWSCKFKKKKIRSNLM